MSDPLSLTQKQQQILKLLYDRERSFGELADELGVSVEEINHLTSPIARLLEHSRIPDTGLKDFRISLNLSGTACAELLIEKERMKKTETRRFWISILSGGLIGWLLSGLGSPQDLLQYLSTLFGRLVR